MSVLYRKYRPQTFADVVGQGHVTRTIETAIASGRVAHAYLFSGPRGVGKTTTARLLAKAVNCERRSASDARSHPEQLRAGRGGSEGSRSLQRAAASDIPCNACDLCTAITEGRCVDVVEIDAASHTQVEKVREEIIETVRIVPAVAARKVFIIDEVHMLSSASFNALLKTIEEPPSHALFILATTELHKVPETIRSRCQQFAFRRVALPDLERRLRDLAGAEGVEVDAAVVASVARAADGSVRDAESMLGQLLALGGKRIEAADAALILPRSSVEHAGALVAAMERADCAAALAEVRFAEDDGFDAEAYVRDVIAALRDAVVAEIHDAQRVAARAAALRIFAELLDHIGRSDHPFFALEVAVLGVIAERQAASAKPQAADTTSQTPIAARPPSSNALVGAGQMEVEKRQVVSPPPLVEGRGSERGRGGFLYEKRRGGVTSPPAHEQSKEADASVHVDAAVVHGHGDEPLARVRSAWSSLVTRLAEVNAALPYLLVGGRPQRIADGVLTIGFRYQLHAEKVKRPDASDALADAVNALLGTRLRIATAVVGIEEFERLDAASRPQTGDAVADAALEVFGGRVVE